MKVADIFHRLVSTHPLSLPWRGPHAGSAQQRSSPAWLLVGLCPRMQKLGWGCHRLGLLQESHPARPLSRDAPQGPLSVFSVKNRWRLVGPVHVTRGEGGFGFTLRGDSPVLIAAVIPGGHAAVGPRPGPTGGGLCGGRRLGCGQGRDSTWDSSPDCPHVPAGGWSAGG